MIIIFIIFFVYLSAQKNENCNVYMLKIITMCKNMEGIQQKICSYCDERAEYYVHLEEKTKYDACVDEIINHIEMRCEYDEKLLIYNFCDKHVNKMENCDHDIDWCHDKYIDTCYKCQQKCILLYYNNIGLCTLCIYEENENKFLCGEHNTITMFEDIKSVYDVPRLYYCEYEDECDINCKNKVYNHYVGFRTCETLKYILSCKCLNCAICNNYVLFNDKIVNIYDIKIGKYSLNDISKDKWNIYDTTEYRKKHIIAMCKLCGYTMTVKVKLIFLDTLYQEICILRLKMSRKSKIFYPFLI